MPLITCPDCQQKVSDRAPTCIHCGCPLKEPDFIVKFKTPSLPKSVVRVKYTFFDNSTSKVLAEAYQNETISLKIDKPTTVRVHVGRGFKDAILQYTPHDKAKYCIAQVNTLFSPRLVIQEVDVLDSDN